MPALPLKKAIFYEFALAYLRSFILLPINPKVMPRQSLHFLSFQHRLQSPLLYFICLTAIVFGINPSAHATELHLSNGDRVTGTVIMRVDGKIHFRSELLGDLVINEVDAAIVETPDTPVESLSGLPPQQKVASKVQPKKQAKPTTVAAMTLTPAPAAATPPPPPPPPPPKWKGKMEFGFLNQSGRSEVNNTSIRVEAEKKIGIDNLRMTGRYLYGENNGAVASDRTDASFRWRRDMSQRVFSQMLTSYAKDRITQIDLNLEQNGSLGYQVFTTERHTMNLGGGLTMQYRDAVNLEPGLNYFGEVFQDYTYKINGRMTISQSLNALYSPNGNDRLANAAAASTSLPEGDNYKVRFNSTLQGKMSERISLNLRYEYEYDNAILDKEARSDQRITSSIGYAF